MSETVRRPIDTSVDRKMDFQEKPEQGNDQNQFAPQDSVELPRLSTDDNQAGDTTDVTPIPNTEDQEDAARLRDDSAVKSPR